MENFYSGFCDGALYCSCFGCTRKQSKLQKLYVEGINRIDHELDIVNVLTKLKNLDVLVNKCLTTSHQQENA